MHRQLPLFYKIIWSTIVDDFRKKPVNKVATTPVIEPPAQPNPTAQPQSQPLSRPDPVVPQPLNTSTGLSTDIPKNKKPRKKIVTWSIIGLISAIILTIGGILVWYNMQLAPVDANNTDKKVVQIESGTMPDGIANLLEEEGLIRNASVFLWHTRLAGIQNSLQAGTYRLSPSESTPEIANHLTSGKVDTFNITFLPGATLEDNREVLVSAGYSEANVDAALAKTYDSPLFAGKPADADLEGYIYGETYSFGTDTTVEAILEHVFEEFYSVVEENNLVEAYKAQGLTLYEGIILASIIQREASSTPDDMPQIAQVFYSRLAIDMQLGSDVTYQYIADKTGVPRDLNLDSPYNTRRFPGLPPGPIAAPGEIALKATAQPAEGDYIYFLNGDDNVTYFAHTLDEHEANIVNHCQKKCQIL